ncbi:MAG: TetR/AcrR family transcriptional regulator [Gammaproteobacteria bacterium]
MSQNRKKKAGRPKEFSDDEVLLAAINVFWAKGYDGTSMRDLTEATGINSPSLYAAFGSKHSLYLKAIDRYISNDACAPLVAFEGEPNIEKAVRAFFLAALDYATQQQSGALGCFLSNCVSASAGEVDGAKELLEQAIKETDIRLGKRFDQEIADGNLDEDFPSLARARLMFDLRQGIVLRARAGLSRRSMTANLDDRVAMVLAT